MDGKKKESEEEKVKIYDKDMYISQEKLNTATIIIIIFIIGFVVGYFAGKISEEAELNTDTENTSYEESQNLE